jgi:3-oxoacyl-[acyl-carrier protein] reductase
MKVALITGGSSGMGEATAKELAKRGWQVAVMFSKNKTEADRVAHEIHGLALQGDVAQDADCRRVAKAVLDKWGRIDALVNSAGTTKFVAHADLEGLSAEDILGILRVNLVGPFQMIRACAAALKEARGCVVNVSSVASILGTGSSIAYAASKAALDTMSFSLARALGPEVRVNIVAPGYVRTPWHVAAHGADGAAEQERRFAERAPLKAAAEPQDVAEAIAWLIEGARRVTGEIVYVDGGMHIASPR